MPIIANNKYYIIKANGKYYDIIRPEFPPIRYCYKQFLSTAVLGYIYRNQLVKTSGEITFDCVDNNHTQATKVSDLESTYTAVCKNVREDGSFQIGALITCRRSPDDDLYT